MRQALTVLAVAGVVHVPGTKAEAQEFPDAATARGVTVTTRPRPEFDPIGLRIGGFQLDASAEGGLGFDSNVFGRESQVESDFFGTWRFQAGLGSDWTRHAVGVTGSYEERKYFDNGILDWRDWGVGIFGRYDIGTFSNLEARYNHRRAHLDVDTVDVQQSGLTRPVPYDVDEFQVSGTTRLNRLGILGIINYQMVRFDNIEGDPAFGQVSINDYDTWIGALGLSYELAPGRYATLTSRLQDIAYTETVAQGRDSFTWEVLAGFRYDFDGVWQARVGIGYTQRNYDDPLLKNLEGVSFDAEVIWAATQLTTVTFAARRRIEESIRFVRADDPAVSYVRTIAGIRADHELLRNVIVTGELSVNRDEYESPDQTATAAGVLIGARWLINRNLALDASYQYVNRFDADPGISEYDRNLVQVRLRIAL